MLIIPYPTYSFSSHIAWGLSRIADVKRTLEEEQVEYDVEREGQIPQIRVDGIIYELIPDAIQAKYLTVHGVKLRKVCG